MADAYFLLIDKVQKGPYPVDELKANGLTPETLVWRKGMPEWIKAREEPALRRLFPYQAPNRPQPAPGKSETTDPKQAAADALNKANQSPPQKSTSSNLADPKIEKLKDWWHGLDSRNQKIAMGIAAAIVVLPLGWLGLSSMGAFGGGKPEFAEVDRHTSLDEDTRAKTQPDKKQIVQKTSGKKSPDTIVSKSPVRKSPVGKQPVTVAGNSQGTNSKLPAGRLSEEYYQLVRNLSYDRVITGQPVATATPQTTQHVINGYKNLGRTAKDDRLRIFALRAAGLWENRPTGNVNSVNTIGGLNGTRPDLLTNRLAGNGIAKTHYEYDNRQRKLWSDVFAYMRNLLDRSGRLTPSLARLQIRPPKPANGRPASAVVNRSLQLKVVNTSKQTLHHVTMQVTLNTPWGDSITNYYYRDTWKDATNWPLQLGPVWGSVGKTLSGGGEIAVWSDQGVMPPTKTVFTTRFPEVVKLGLDHCRKELDLGRYTTSLHVAGGIAKNNTAQVGSRTTAKRLHAKAERIQSSHRALLALAVPDKTYIGLWRFGKYRGEIGLKFQKPEVTINSLPIANAANARVRTPIAANIYAPERPPEYKRLNGQIEYHPQQERFILTLGSAAAFGAVNQQIGIAGEPTRLPDQTANYLLRKNTRKYLFVEKQGELIGRSKRGDELRLVPISGSQSKSRLADLKSDVNDYKATRAIGKVNAIPAELIQKIETKFPDRLDWQLGEIRRFDTAGEEKTGTRKSKPKKWQPAPLLQVVFAKDAAILFGTTTRHTISWNMRTAREDFRSVTGYPIVVSPKRRFIAVPSTQGTRLFNGRKGTRQKSKVDTSSYAVAFSEDGKLLASAGTDGRVNVWGLKDQRLMSGKHSTAVAAVAISPDAKLVASASKDRKISLWSLKEKGKYVGGFDSGKFEILAMRFSNDSSHVMTVAKVTQTIGSAVQHPQQKIVDPLQEVAPSSQYEVQIWSVNSRKSVYIARIGRQAKCIDISPDWRYALTGENDGIISLWDLKTGLETHRFVGHTKPMKTVAFSPDGRFAASGSEDGYVILWGLPGGEQADSSSAAKKKRIAAPMRTLTVEEQKRQSALKRIESAEAAVKANLSDRAAKLLKEAEQIAGSDPIVARELKRVRTQLLGPGT